jgi:hypothetical protein
MSMLNDIKTNIGDHMKSLPDWHIAESTNFKGWGKEFVDLIVSVSYIFVTNRLTHPRPSMRLSW